MANQSQAAPVTFVNPGLAGIKNIIAIASGKGGVGKSTVSTNLAVALKLTGAKVGLMDADIYGPSQPGMLGSSGARPNVSENQIYPINKHGIDFMSIGLLLGEDAPVIWRAPMATKMINQFLGNVAWGELDYLLIDLPPGTGDVQLTLAQQAHLTGAVIVTTPQQVALGVAKKGLKMFEQVNVPIVGIIENMSGFTCSHCGELTDLFKIGGGKAMATETGYNFLGALPLDPEIMAAGDNGEPVLSKSTDSPAAIAFTNLAEQFLASVKEIKEKAGDEPDHMEINGDGNVVVHWPDGHHGIHKPFNLRINCPCAACIDEDTGVRTLDPKNVQLDIGIKSTTPVGRYAIAFDYTDGHNTGLYSFALLRQLCECDECKKLRGSDQQSFSI